MSEKGSSEPDEAALRELEGRAGNIRDRWIAQARKRSYGDQDIRPVVIEFAGSPRAGKSSTIDIIHHFFRRTGFRVFAQAEGASKRTPSSLKGDLVAFNAWSLNYGISELLVAFNSIDRPNIILLDRGPFDAVVWMRYLEADHQLGKQERETIENYALFPKWIKMIDSAFVFTCDPAVSLERELRKKLTLKPGLAMNAKVLGSLLARYEEVRVELQSRYHVESIDTSSDNSPKYPAFRIATRILEIADQRLRDDLTDSIVDETVVVVPSAAVRAWASKSELWTDVDAVEALNRVISDRRAIVPRADAEDDTAVKQLIAYAIVRNAHGVLCLRRAESEKRPELRGKLSILFGGHVDGRDADGGGDVLRNALRREILEELQFAIPESTRFLGFATDPTTPVGRLHFGAIFQIEVEQTAVVVGAGADLADYFDGAGGRMLHFKPIDWIRDHVAQLDPWSATVFAAVLSSPGR